MLRNTIGFVGLLVMCMLSISSLSAQEAGPDSNYYKKQINILSYPPYKRLSGKVVTPKKGDVRSQLQPMRMTFHSIANVTPESAEKYVKSAKSQGFNAVMGEGHRYLFKDDENQKITANVITGGTYQQLLKDAKVMADACRKYGVKFFLHQTSTMVDKSLIVKHPDWAAIDIVTGKPVTNAYGTENTCLNNDGFMDEFYARLERLLMESRPDGLMQDEIQFFSPTLCGCKWCRDKFTKATGYAIPDKDHLDGWMGHYVDNPSYAAWLAWRRDVVCNTFAKIKLMLEKANPQAAMVDYLANPAPSSGYVGAGYVIDDFTKRAEIVGYECEPPGNNYLYYTPLVIPEMKYLRAVAEIIDTDPFRLSYDSTPADCIWNWLVSMSQGTGKAWVTTRSWLSEVYVPTTAWLADNDKLFGHLKTYADIGIQFSLDTRDRNPNNVNKRSWIHGFFSTCNALTDGHIPYKVILDQQMNESTLRKNIKTLILFNTGSMSDEAVKAVRGFVKGGGTIIASSDTSLYDQTGKKRKDFALADVFGFSYKGVNTSASVLEIQNKDRAIGNLVGSFKHEHPFNLVEVKSPDVKTVGQMKLDDGSHYPGILIRKYGKGNVIYFTGHPEYEYLYYYYNEPSLEPGKPWTDNRNADYAKLICAVASTGSKTPVMKVNNLPKGVLAEVYTKDADGIKGIQVNLANILGGEMTTGIVPELQEISFPDVKAKLPKPGKPIDITIRAKDVKQVYLISPDFDEIVEPAIQKTSETVKVSIPTIYRYSILFFNKSESIPDFVKGRKIVKTVPRAKDLIVKERTPLVGKYVPGSVTVFADSEKVIGGSHIGVYKDEMSRFIFGSESKIRNFEVYMDVTKAFEKPVLEIGGMEAVAPVEIYFNKVLVFKGSQHWGNDEWSVSSFIIEPSNVKIGRNTLEILNTGIGSVSAVPWFGISFARLKEAGG